MVELVCDGGTDSRSCSVATFDIGDVKATGFVTGDVVSHASFI